MQWLGGGRRREEMYCLEGRGREGENGMWGYRGREEGREEGWRMRDGGWEGERETGGYKEIRESEQERAGVGEKGGLEG
jgi:hypothetical protein